VLVSWNIDCLTVTCKNGHVKSSWNLTVWSLTGCMAHVSTSWNIDCLKLYYMYITNQSLKNSTSCTGCLAGVSKLKHRLLQIDLQNWTRQVELNHRLLEVVLYHCTCVLELKHWLLEVVLPVSLDVWHVFVRWNIDSLTVTCKNVHVKSSWNLTVWSLTVCMAHVS
jgi:hypothetical protein